MNMDKSVTQVIDAAPFQQDGELALEVRDLSVEFESNGEWIQAATDLNYDVYKGEILAIVGESGSGKSSSAMALLGLLPENCRTSGSIKLNGEEIGNLDAGALRRLRGKRIAVVFQEPMTALDPLYTVGKQIIEAITVHNNMSKSAARQRALELLEIVGLPNPEKTFASYPHQLSGGQCQRVVIAQAISCDPDVLIADEATTALDVTVQAEILDLLRNLRHRLHSAILLITHDMGVVADLADRVVVMRSGRIVEIGSTQQIFANAQQPYTQELLSAVPRLGATTVREHVVNRDDAPSLSMKNVTIDYPKQGNSPVFRAVEDFSLDIHAGELVALVGESGSGKTTIGRAVMGLVPIASGEVSVLGHDLWKLKKAALRDVRRQIGIVFQDPTSSLDPRMKIGESIGEPLKVAGVAKGRRLDSMVEDLLEQVELPRAFFGRYPNELSGGQKQRVVIARALALSPKLLVADEPTSALDVSVQARFLELLLQLQQNLQFACLFISHDLAVVDLLAHRVVVLRNGKLVEEGPRDAVLRNAKEPYTQRLISAVPLPDPEAQRINRERRVASLRA